MKYFIYASIVILLISCDFLYSDLDPPRCDKDGYKQDPFSYACVTYDLNRPISFETSDLIIGDSISDYTIRLGYFDEDNLTFYVKHEKNYLPNQRYLKYNKSTGIDSYGNRGVDFEEFSESDEGWSPNVHDISITNFNPSGRMDVIISSIVDTTYKAYITKDTGKIFFSGNSFYIFETGNINIFDLNGLRTDADGDYIFNRYSLENTSYSDINFVSY